MSVLARLKNSAGRRLVTFPYNDLMRITYTKDFKGKYVLKLYLKTYENGSFYLMWGLNTADVDAVEECLRDAETRQSELFSKTSSATDNRKRIIESPATEDKKRTKTGSSPDYDVWHDRCR
eukprot:TRINITY_DN570_c0_g1_i3.p1 TRINITY_DN570_c0_g1~~TRINITY_DN570_c0_g1_i3.p1  ORF type:complete len:121 (-),score=0.87 TRINITY_DN570_c0_g1_i3:187-549(-)